MNMQKLITGAIAVGALFSCHLLAQHSTRGAGAAGFMGPTQSTVPFHTSSFKFRSRDSFRRGRFFGSWAWAFDPFYGSGYPDYYEDGAYGGYPQQPSVVVVMPQVHIMPPPPPPQPVKPELRQYSWPASAGNGAATFSLATKDHGVQSAIAVCLDGNSVLYTAPDGSQRRIPVDSLDRKRTRELNAAKQMSLPWLPAGD